MAQRKETILVGDSGLLQVRDIRDASIVIAINQEGIGRVVKCREYPNDHYEVRLHLPEQDNDGAAHTAEAEIVPSGTTPILSIEALREIQMNRGLGAWHLVSLRGVHFTIAHTDAERAAGGDLHECELHEWLEDVGPPAQGDFIVKPRDASLLDGPGWHLEPLDPPPNVHTLVITYEGGYVTAKLECPETGCVPGHCGGEAGAGDCSSDALCEVCQASAQEYGCWLKGWHEAEDLVSSGYLSGEVRLPVTATYDGEGPVVEIVKPD